MNNEDLVKALLIVGGIAVLMGLAGFLIIYIIKYISGLPFDDIEIVPWYFLGAGLVSWLIATVLYFWPQSRYG